MKLLYSILFVFIIPMVNAQDTVTIQECLFLASGNHPRTTDVDLLTTISEKNILNAKTNWLPDIDLNAKARYQSDVIEIDVDMPAPGVEFPTAPKDQYSVNLDVSQPLYDAGRTKKGVELEEVKLHSGLVELETVIEQNKEIVTNLYYNILILQENFNSIDVTLDQLNKSVNVVQAGIKNGIMLQSDLDQILVEKKKLIQRKNELIFRKKSIIDAMNLKTEGDFNGNTYFRLSEFEVPDNNEILRKELELMDARKNVIAKTSELVSSKRLPLVYAFGQAGYGNPGLNMLNDKFDTYYIVGAGLSWNIWDWNSVKREKEVLELQSKLIDNKKQELINDLNLALIQQKAMIKTHRENIESYREILRLRSGISKTYYSMLENGTAKTIDYISVLNEEKQARIQLVTEKIMLQKSIADYYYITGTL